MKSCPECGCVLEMDGEKGRSTPQQRRQFAIFKRAWFHWPKTNHEFQPRNSEHLRYWLEMQAGHYDVLMNVRVNSIDPDKLAALLSAVLGHAEADYMFLDLQGNLLTVKKVKSISYSSLSHEDACKLFDEIANVLHVEAGLNAEELLQERVV